jgi:RNA polymerase sigma factor (sigma-70 family)
MATHPISVGDFDLLCDVIRAVARSSGLAAPDAEDFVQTAHLKLLERNYAPVTRFAGRSSLRTYLLVVVRRLLLDWRNANYGKWRPTAAARRLGPDAVVLDRLISRDGYPGAEAIAILENRRDTSCPATLHALATKLARRKRPQFIAVDDEPLLGTVEFEDPVEAAQASAELRMVVARLRRAFGLLAPVDRQLLRLRFKENMPIVAIASELGIPVNVLYRRLQGLLRTLRQDTAGTQSVQPSRVVVKEEGRKKPVLRVPSDRIH